MVEITVVFFSVLSCRVRVCESFNLSLVDIFRSVGIWRDDTYPVFQRPNL